MTTSLVSVSDGWRLRFQTAEVRRFVVGYDLKLELELEDGRLLIRIGGPFDLSDDTGTRTLAVRDSDSIGHVFKLMGHTLTAMAVSADGSLDLRFGSGERILVPPDRRYEAWEAHAPGGLILVSKPGGGMTIFGTVVAEVE